MARNLYVGLLVAALGITAYAEQRGEVLLVRPPVSPAVRFVGPWRPNGAPNGVTRVVGSVIDIRQIPVGDAQVQLRDLKTGAVLAQDVTTELGEYEFAGVEPGTYVVEMVLSADYVIALSNAGSLARFQTLQTVIQLPGRWDFAARTMSIPVAPISFFGIGSANTMTSSTMTMAADSNIRPIDAGEPVSPQ
jgi:hypothetical protein